MRLRLLTVTVVALAVFVFECKADGCDDMQRRFQDKYSDLKVVDKRDHYDTVGFQRGDIFVDLHCANEYHQASFNIFSFVMKRPSKEFLIMGATLASYVFTVSDDIMRRLIMACFKEARSDKHSQSSVSFGTGSFLCGLKGDAAIDETNLLFFDKP